MKKIITLIAACALSGNLLFAQEQPNAKVLEHASIYSEFVKQKNYAEALPSWRYVFNNAPKFQQLTYQRGEDIMIGMYAKTKNPAYIDTLMMVYDQWMTYYPNKNAKGKLGKGYILGKKGFSLYRYGKKSDAITQEAYGYLMSSYELEKKASYPLIVRTAFAVGDELLKKNLITKEEYINNYMKFVDYCEFGRVHSSKPDDYVDVKGTLDALFFNAGVADCGTLTGFLEPQYQKAPLDKSNLENISRLLRRRECTETPLFAKVSEALYKVDPTSESAYNLAILFLKRKEYDKTEQYLNEAIDKGTDGEEKADYYLRRAQLRLSKGLFRAAKEDALGALRMNPKLGNAYIVIGNAYAAYSKSYGDDEYEHTTVYWAAVDKYIKAKEVDPAVSDEANRYIRSYSQHFPAKSEAFFHSVTEGASVKIGDWINETTTARFRNE